MAETLTQPTGLLVLGAGGRLTCSVPVGPVFAPRSFAKTSNERAGKAPVVRDDGTRLGTVAAITETADAFTFEVDADDAKHGSRPTTQRQPPMNEHIEKIQAERSASMLELKQILDVATRDLSPAEAKRADELQETVEQIDGRLADIAYRNDAADLAAKVPSLNFTSESPAERTTGIEAW